jgi:predicted MFS family arabinose efflux permease
MDNQPTPPGFDEGFYTRTLIRAHFFAGLAAAAIAGKVADSFGYNGVPWAFGACGVTSVVLVVWIVVRRIRARRVAER